MKLLEAKWFADKISQMNIADIVPILHIGVVDDSQVEAENYLYQEVKKYGSVYTLDLKNHKRVDIVGDINDKQVLSKLYNLELKSVSCFNLLEHVTDISETCRNIVSLIKPGGYIFVSCPYRYPYHPAPIDNGFRPDIEELSRCFPNTRVIYKEIISTGSFLLDILSNPVLALRIIVRLLLPFYNWSGWKVVVGYCRWFFRKYYTTCLILQKT
jgi:SAM-dependent methyltransferase